MRGILMEKEKQSLSSENLNGIYSEIASILGIEAAVKLHEKYRGTQVTFPVEILSREYIFEQMRNEYNGYNVREIAVKYGYTEKWVRKVLK